MDTRYRDRGYTADLIEAKHGAYLTLKRNGVVVGEVSIGYFQAGPDALPQVMVTRFRQNEIGDVNAVNNYDD